MSILSYFTAVSNGVNLQEHGISIICWRLIQYASLSITRCRFFMCFTKYSKISTWQYIAAICNTFQPRFVTASIDKSASYTQWLWFACLISVSENIARSLSRRGSPSSIRLIANTLFYLTAKCKAFHFFKFDEDVFTPFYRINFNTLFLFSKMARISREFFYGPHS